MVPINKVPSELKKFAVQHTPELLTAGTVAALGGTAVTSCIAQHNADVKVWNTEAQLGRRLDKKEIVKLTWTDYILPATMVASGSAASIKSCLIGKAKYNAAMTELGTVTDILGSYKASVASVVSGEVVEQIKEHVDDHNVKPEVNDKLSKEPIVIVNNTDEFTCYDRVSKRFFKSNMGKIKEAENVLNATLIDGLGTFVPVNEYFMALGLDATGIGWDIGWDFAVDGMIKLRCSSILTEAGVPVLAVEPDQYPKPRRGM